MKRVVLFAMVLMLGVVSVQAQWSVVPEAGMTVMKAGPMVDWKPSWKIGVGVEYQLKPEFLSLKSGLYYTQRGYSNDNSPDMDMGIIGGLCRDLLMIRMDMRMITQIR